MVSLGLCKLGLRNYKCIIETLVLQNEDVELERRGCLMNNAIGCIVGNILFIVFRAQSILGSESQDVGFINGKQNSRWKYPKMTGTICVRYKKTNKNSHFFIIIRTTKK